MKYSQNCVKGGVPRNLVKFHLSFGKTGGKNVQLNCFAALLQKEWKSGVARFTTQRLNLLTTLFVARQV